MKVEKTDGTFLEFPVHEIKRVYVDKKLCPDDNHPHKIDLGIGVKWACCNVGATQPEGYGKYFAWGEIEEKDTCSWATYKHCDGTAETCHDIGTDISGTSYDAAHTLWQDSWRMPSFQDLEALLTCPSEWTTVNGVNGRKFYGPNGNCIFLPAAGYHWNFKSHSVGTWGIYWMSTIMPDMNQSAYSLSFYRGDADWLSQGRVNGCTIRPVVK